MPKDYAALAKQAADMTNKELGSQITDLTRMTTADLDRLLPNQGDRTQFVELMKIVQKETNEDQAVAKTVGDVARFGKVIVKVLKYFA